MTVGGPLVLVWEFHVAAAHREEFERRYGPAGDWARLFSRHAGYLGTQLLRDTAMAEADGTHRYLTLDRWRSPADWDAFRAAHAADYRALDAACEALTVAERPLGAHTDVASAFAAGLAGEL